MLVCTFKHNLCRMKLMVQIPRKRYEYERARFLRKKGKSYNQIMAELNLAKSTVNYWCSDIMLTLEQRRVLLKRRSELLSFFNKGAQANKKKRAKEILVVKNKAQSEIKKVGKNAFKIAGAMIYWSEGTKSENTAVTNSDPRIIKFIVKWWEQIFYIKPNSLKAYLHIHYGDDEHKIKIFWSNLTGIPIENFGKSFIKPKGTGHRTHILPNGIIRVGVKGKGVGNLRHRILAWIDKIYNLSVD